MKPEIKTSTWPNGQKSVETPYVNGKKHGLVTGWYENGQKQYEIPYVNGQQHGIETWWYSHGQKWHEIPYVNGQLHGFETWWFSGGSLSTARKRHQDQLVWEINLYSKEQIPEDAEVELFFHETPEVI